MSKEPQKETFGEALKRLAETKFIKEFNEARTIDNALFFMNLTDDVSWSDAVYNDNSVYIDDGMIIQFVDKIFSKFTSVEAARAIINDAGKNHGVNLNKINLEGLSDEKTLDLCKGIIADIFIPKLKENLRIDSIARGFAYY